MAKAEKSGENQPANHDEVLRELANLKSEVRMKDNLYAVREILVRLIEIVEKSLTSE